METPGDREPGADPEPPPGLSKGDQYLYREMGREIGQVRADMNEIARVVSALPAGVDAKIEPLNTRLDALDRAIDSFVKLAEDVQKIREEFTGFRGFRERIEGYEKRVIRWAVGAVGTIVLAAFYVGWNMKGISADVAEMKDSVGEAKDSINKLQAATYELNGTIKGQGERLNSQGERLKSIDGQFRAVQISVREASARTATETSDKTAERIAGELQAFKKDMAGRFDAYERKVEEASDVLVLSLVLNPGDKPVGGSDKTLDYYPPVPPQQKQKVIHTVRSRSKMLLYGVVNLYEGEEPLRLAGLVAATAQPMKDEGRIPIHLQFQDKSAREEFEKLMDRLREDRKPLRLKVTFALG